MNPIGEYVINKAINTVAGRRSYDVGKIVEQPNPNSIRVKYNNPDRVITYQYPDAFECFLQFSDPDLQERVEDLMYRMPVKEGAYNTTEPVADDFPPFPTVQPVWVENDKPSSILCSKKLEMYCWYDSNGQDIYKRCCKVFGWDINRADDFGQHTTMYSRKVTAEGYSVWFLTHHQWIEKEWNGKWFNHIGRDVVYEDWDDRRMDESDRHNLNYDFTKRLTFAKGKNSKYYYIGVFEPIKIIENQIDGTRFFHTKIYKRINRRSCYPEE